METSQASEKTHQLQHDVVAAVAVGLSYGYRLPSHFAAPPPGQFALWNIIYYCWTLLR